MTNIIIEFYAKYNPNHKIYIAGLYLQWAPGLAKMFLNTAL